MKNNIHHKIFGKMLGKLLGLAMLFLSGSHAYGMDGLLDDGRLILSSEESFNLFYGEGLSEDQNIYQQQEALQQKCGVQEHEKKEEDKSLVWSMQGEVCPFPNCGRKFAWKSQYDIHVRSHTKEKPYMCKTCNRGFSYESNLRYHIRDKHPEQKPLSCKFCGQSFRRNKNRTVHMQKHRAILAPQRFAIDVQKQDAYECSQCDKLFKSKIGLDNHMRTHAEKKIRACDACGKTFICMGRFKHHIFQCSKQRE